MIYKNVLKLLDDSKFPYQVHEHPPVRTIDEAKEKVPHLTRNLLKTIVFRIKDSHWILAAVKRPDRIHYKKLADAFGIGRRALRPISPEEVENGLGFEVGGVGPFPVREDVRVVIDESLPGLDKVFCGSGRNTRTIELKLEDLISLSHAKIYSVMR